MIVVENFEVLRDDGLRYAKRLRDFGVETVVHEGQGFYGDYLKVTPEFLRSQTGTKANRDVCKFIRRITEKK